MLAIRTRQERVNNDSEATQMVATVEIGLVLGKRNLERMDMERLNHTHHVH